MGRPHCDCYSYEVCNVCADTCAPVDCGESPCKCGPREVCTHCATATRHLALETDDPVWDWPASRRRKVSQERLDRQRETALYATPAVFSLLCVLRRAHVGGRRFARHARRDAFAALARLGVRVRAKVGPT